MAREVFHVLPAGDDNWRVAPEGSNTGPLFERKDEAVRHAKEKAQAAQLGQVVVHGRNGRIQYENTYGEDPHQRKE
jgi:hypothetical protein